MKQYISELIGESLTNLYGDEGKSVSATGVYAISFPSAEFGDYASNAALVLFKNFKVAPAKSPQELAEILAKKCIELDHIQTFSEIKPVNGFINFRLSQKHLLHNLETIIKSGSNYGSSQIGSGKTAIIEYFQLNVAKLPHVGHLRSAVIGDALNRMLRFQGYHVLSDTHVGDWGTQFGIMIAAYKKYGNKTVVEKDPLNELEKLYVKYNQDMESDPALREIGKQEFAKLEQGDKENRELWQWFVDVSMNKLEEMAKLLALEPFDLHLGESFYEDKMAAIVKECLDKNIAQTGSEGELFVDLAEFGLDQGILKKSDGASTYLLRDLAKLQYVWQQYHFDLNLYIVDVRQSHHFNQLFKIAELLGWEAVKLSQHIDFGFLKLPEGILSSRKGTSVALGKVVEEATSRAEKIIEQKNPGLKNKADVARQVGLAALKYFDLSHNRQSDIVFDWDKALSFEGNAGPYLQYAHARIYGILRKADHDMITTKSDSDELDQRFVDMELNKHELSVLRKLHQFPEVLENLIIEYLPNLLCNYLFELSQDFNSFYQNVPVRGEPDSKIRDFRFVLVKTTAQVLKNGLALLGIEAPEEM